MKPVDRQPASELELEILGTLWDASETVATVLPDLPNPSNVDRFSPAAKALDRAGLNAVFERLRDLGLVVGHEEASDGYEMEPGRTYTWWSMTADGRLASKAREDARDEIASAELDACIDGAETVHTTRPAKAATSWTSERSGAA